MPLAVVANAFLSCIIPLPLLLLITISALKISTLKADGVQKLQYAPLTTVGEFPSISQFLSRSASILVHTKAAFKGFECLISTKDECFVCLLVCCATT